MLVKDLIAIKKGKILFFEIPCSLIPKMVPQNIINSFDSNNGVDSAWTKILIHQLKEG